MSATLQERFEEKYIPEPMSGCWLWTGCVGPKGYGRIFHDRWIKPRNALAHRISYEMYCGPVPDGMLVCHRCDVPSCVNPDHLFLGTNADNMADKVAKGRKSGLAGLANGRAKLTEADVQSIRAETISYKAIAAKYGISDTLAQRIRTNDAWTHIPWPAGVPIVGRSPWQGKRLAYMREWNAKRKATAPCPPAA